MDVKHNYSYIGKEQKLVDKGYAKVGVNALILDRCFSEEEKSNNQMDSDTMTSEEWESHCSTLSKSIYENLHPIVEMLNEKYEIDQFEEESSLDYNEDWDLFFYSNKGWNNQTHYDYVRLSFNDDRDIDQNLKLMEEIVSLIEKLDVDNIHCIIQYQVVLDKKKIDKKAIEICEKLLNKPVEYNSMQGKIRVISEHENVKKYGFYKKNAKTNFYKVSNREIVLNFV